MLVAAGLSAPGCATHRLGLLVYDQAAADPPVVRGPDGAQTVIAARGDADPVRFLDGCIVELTGPMAFGVLHVRDWRVIDAGDGSGNFVGTLRAYGARLIIDDRNSRSPVILDDLTAAPLRPYVGYPVLVIGHVTGAGYVVPVAFRVLADVAR